MTTVESDVLVLGLWHDDELVIGWRSRLEWYAAMHAARSGSATWGDFLSTVAAIDAATAQQLREEYEPDDDSFDPDEMSDADGLPWPGLPAEEGIGAAVEAALEPLLERANSPGGIDYTYLNESDNQEALALLRAVGIPAERDDALTAAGYADDSW